MEQQKFIKFRRVYSIARTTFYGGAIALFFYLCFSIDSSKDSLTKSIDDWTYYSENFENSAELALLSPTNGIAADNLRSATVWLENDVGLNSRVSRELANLTLLLERLDSSADEPLSDNDKEFLLALTNSIEKTVVNTYGHPNTLLFLYLFSDSERVLRRMLIAFIPIVLLIISDILIVESLEKRGVITEEQRLMLDSSLPCDLDSF